MGHEHVVDGFMRSSVELRRIKNARVTAMRQWKWQEVRKKREQDEQKAAEEILRRRRKERARLARYIYSSAQDAEKESCCRYQTSQDRNREMLEKRRGGFVCGSNATLPKVNPDKNIILDVCSLPAISIKEDGSHHFLPKHHAGQEQRFPEATKDFVEDVLQERLRNEAATSVLIAEITDMKSRLDDLLLKPFASDFVDPSLKGLMSEKKGIEKCIDMNQEFNIPAQDSTALVGPGHLVGTRDGGCEVEKTRAPFTPNESKQSGALLRERSGTQGSMKANQALCMADYHSHSITSTEKNKVVFSQSSKVCAIADPSCLPSSNVGHLAHRRNKGEKSYCREKAFSCKDCGPISDLPFHPDHKKRLYSPTLSGDLREMEADKDVLAPVEEDLHERRSNLAEICPKSKPQHRENSFADVKEPLSFGKPSYSYASPTHKGMPLKPFPGSSDSKENSVSCLKSRKGNEKIFDAEKSLLASLERLDVKLAIVSAKTSNSSRTSLVSAGQQSTKSAPCMARQKLGSDAYSVNSTMFTTRPTTSHVGGPALVSRRRQNVGLTNAFKDGINHFQTWNSQECQRLHAVPTTNNGGMEKKPAAGTITVHQNAEFLFS